MLWDTQSYIMQFRDVIIKLQLFCNYVAFDLIQPATNIAQSTQKYQKNLKLQIEDLTADRR